MRKLTQDEERAHWITEEEIEAKAKQRRFWADVRRCMGVLIGLGTILAPGMLLVAALVWLFAVLF